MSIRARALRCRMRPGNRGQSKLSDPSSGWRLKMTRFGFMSVPVCIAVFAGMASAQTPAKVDFARDIVQLFRQNCTGCHGPSMQQAGLRLDRKSSVMKAFSRRVVPGSSENSFLYHRVSGSEFGPQMPPTGDLRPEQIKL